MRAFVCLIGFDLVIIVVVGPSQAGADPNMVVYREDGSKITALDIARMISNEGVSNVHHAYIHPG